MTHKTISVFGANGATAREFISEALKSGHTVRVLTRDSNSFPALESHPNLIVFRDNTFSDPKLVAETLKGAEFIFSALTQPSIAGPDTICSHTFKLFSKAIQGMPKGQLKKIVFSGVVVMGSDKRTRPWFSNIFQHWIVKGVAAEQARIEGFIQDIAETVETEWTILRPGLLTKRFEHIAGDTKVKNRKKSGALSYSRSDLARAALTDCIEGSRWSRRTVTIMGHLD